MKEFVFALLLAMTLGLLVSGCAQEKIGNQAGPAASTNNTSVQQNPAPTPDTSIESAARSNLMLSDLPPGYSLNSSYSGFTTDALNYTDGDAFNAKWLGDYGWVSADEADYQKYLRNGTAMDEIYSGISLYKNATYVDCTLKQVGLAMLKSNATLMLTKRTYGDASALYSFRTNDPEFGPVQGYELKFYYGNVFVNLLLAGPLGESTLLDVDRYATILEQRLKSACPDCEKAPKCPRKLETENP